MADGKKWREILDGEIVLWSKKTCEQIVAELDATDAYQVKVDSVNYTVEVELLENTESYVHVAISIDDGRLPASIFPVSGSFILKK